jgi:hypothetical protein
VVLLVSALSLLAPLRHVEARRPSLNSLPSSPTPSLTASPTPWLEPSSVATSKAPPGVVRTPYPTIAGTPTPTATPTAVLPAETAPMPNPDEEEGVSEEEPGPTRTAKPSGPTATSLPRPTRTPGTGATPTPTLAPVPILPPLNEASFVPIPFSDAELISPFRGLYKWRGQEQVLEPFDGRSLDAYERYQWSELEGAEGIYDFSPIEDDLEQAAREGRRFALRIRAVVSERSRSVPAYLTERMERGWWHDYDRDGRDDTYVPDWNDPDFLQRLDALLAALGERYDGDPRLSYVDIGIYGNWGEWHMHRFPYPSPSGAQSASWDSKKAIIDAHVRAFPNTRLLSMTDDRRALAYALSLSPTIGWRRDSLGNRHFNSLRDDTAAWELARDRWKTAPVVVEFFNVRGLSDPASLQLARDQVRDFHVSLVGNGNAYKWSQLSDEGRAAFVEMAKYAGYRLVLDHVKTQERLLLGQAFSLETRWRNLGVAPLYEPWEAVFQLRDTTGSIAWEGVSRADLRELLPADAEAQSSGILTLSDTFQLPSTLSPGSYSLRLILRDPSGYREPLQLAVRGQIADGSYALGAITVGQ